MVKLSATFPADQKYSDLFVNIKKVKISDSACKTFS